MEKLEKKDRPVKISSKAFMEVYAKSDSPAQVISTFKVLREMEPSKAKSYVAIRAWNLRAKGFTMKLFPRGRHKSTSKIETAAAPTTIVTAPIL